MIKKRVFIKYTICYFSVVLFIFLFGFLAVRTLLSQYKREVTDSVQKQQEKVITLLENNIIHQATVANEIYVDKSTNPRELQKDSVTEYRGIQTLDDYKKTLVLNDVLFLSYTEGIFYTPLGKTGFPVYSGTTLRLEEKSRTCFMEEIANPKGYSCSVLTATGGEKILLFVYPVPQTQNPSRGVVGFMIRESTIRQMIEQEILNYSYLAVMDFNGTAFAQTNHANDLSKAEQDTLIKDIFSGKNEERFGYVIINYPASEYGFSLHIAISTHQIWSKVNQIEYWLIFYCVSLFLLVCVILIIVNWLNTRPILKLQKFVLEKSGVHEKALQEETIRKGNEIAVIENIIEITLEDKRQKEEKIETFTNMMKEHMAFILTSGVITQKEMLESILQVYHITFTFPFYAVLGALCKQDIPQDCFYITKEKEEFKICCIHDEKKNCLCVVVGLQDVDYMAKCREKIAQELCSEFIKKKINVLLCAWGMVYPTLEKVHDSYREMLSVLRLADPMNSFNSADSINLTNFINSAVKTGDGIPVLLFERTAKLKHHQNMVSQKNSEVFKTAIRDFDLQGAEKAFSVLMEDYQTISGQNEELRRFHRYAVVSSILSECALTQNKMQHLIGTLEMKDRDFEHEIRLCLRETLGTGNGLEKRSEINDIIQYIQGNYMNPDLSQSSVSDYFGMTQSNFSKYIKNQTGRNYSDYVNDLRMQEACRLLQKTDFSIAKIVSMVGYLDGSAFTRKFKSCQGQTPKQYRELHRKL